MGDTDGASLAVDGSGRDLDVNCGVLLRGEVERKACGCLAEGLVVPPGCRSGPSRCDQFVTVYLTFTWQSAVSTEKGLDR